MTPHRPPMPHGTSVWAVLTVRQPLASRRIDGRQVTSTPANAVRGEPRRDLAAHLLKLAAAVAAVSLREQLRLRDPFVTVLGHLGHDATTPDECIVKCLLITVRVYYIVV